MKNILHIFTWISLILMFHSGYAQDAHLSQFFAAPMLLNPALTGSYDGSDRVHVHHRDQWRSITSSPFVTSYVSYDKRHLRYGYGGYIYQNKAGEGDLKTFRAVASGSYEITSDPKGVHHLLTGLQLGIIQKSLKPSQLNYANQYVKSLDGSYFDPTISSGETFQDYSMIKPEVNFGVYYYTRNFSSKFNPYVGMSGQHLSHPKESFMGTDNRLAPLVSANAGVVYEINDEISVDPSVLFLNQKNNKEFKYGFMVQYFYAEKDAYIFAGPYYRHDDAVVMHLGVQTREYSFRFSYDLTTSGLKTINNGNGAYEISLTYIRKRRKRIPSL